MWATRRALNELDDVNPTLVEPFENFLMDTG